MIGVTLTARADKVDRGLQNLSKAFSNRTALNKRLGLAGVRWITKNFQREGKPKWRRLKDSTANARIRPGSPRRRGSGHVLVSTGRYRASFASNANSRSVRIGSPWKISIVHEEGRGSMPKRSVLPTKQQAQREIVNPVAGDYIKESVRKSGLD